LLVTLASSTASANPIPGPFDVMHLIVYINFPFNGLLLLLLVEVAYRDRMDPPFGPLSFLLTFLLSAAVITFVGAMIDGFIGFITFTTFLFLAILVGASAGLISIRYLGFSPNMGAMTVFAFGTLNILVWTGARLGDINFGVMLVNRPFLHLCYALVILLAFAIAFNRFRQTRVVTIDPRTGDRGLERLDHGPAWELAREVLGHRTLNELLAICLVTMIVAVVLPMRYGTPL